MTATCSPLARVKPSAPKRGSAPCCAAPGPLRRPAAARTTSRTAVRRLGIKLSWSAIGVARSATLAIAAAVRPPGAISVTRRRLENAFEQRLLLALDDRRLAFRHRLAGRGVLAQALR